MGTDLPSEARWGVGGLPRRFWLTHSGKTSSRCSRRAGNLPKLAEPTFSFHPRRDLAPAQTPMHNRRLSHGERQNKHLRRYCTSCESDRHTPTVSLHKSRWNGTHTFENPQKSLVSYASTHVVQNLSLKDEPSVLFSALFTRSRFVFLKMCVEKALLPICWLLRCLTMDVIHKWMSRYNKIVQS